MALPSVAVSFFAVGLVILVGSLTLWTFQRTRFPDVPLLLALGLLLGPLNATAVKFGYGSASLEQAVQVDTVRQIAPLISNLALVLILFDSGLKLDFSQFGRSLRPAAMHTFPLFLLTVITLSVLAHWFLGMPPLVATVLGVALSNVGQTVSASIIREMRLDADVRSIYFVEMALYDLISVPLVVSLLQFAEGASPDAGAFAQSLARVISISLVLGLLMGILWIYLLLKLEGYAYSYMITFASILLLFSVNSYLGGSGVVSVLIYGLVVGNRASVMRMADIKGSLKHEGEKVHAFHDEITFFVRAFFFVFLGYTFSTGANANGWSINTKIPLLQGLDNSGALFLLAVLLMFGAIVGARYLVVHLVSARNNPKRKALAIVYGRGLGTAVLATFAFNQEAFRQTDSAYHRLFAPWEPIFTDIALLIVLLTVLGTSLTVWLHERAAPPLDAKTVGRRSAARPSKPQ